MQRVIVMAGVAKAELAILEKRRRITAQKKRAEAGQNQDDQEDGPHADLTGRGQYVCAHQFVHFMMTG